MTEEHKQCGATTKAGSQCKNRTMGDSDYCRAHQLLAEESAGQPTSAVDIQEIGIEDEPVVDSGPPTGGDSDQSRVQANFEILAAELNALASEIQASIPDYVPPVFTPDGLAALVKSNLDKFTPDMQIEILSDLRRNLEGTSPRDLIDPDTWKGLWYILNYTVQAQSAAMIENVYGRLAALPGVALLSDLKGNLAGTSPKEFLDPDTWKGMWLIMNYSVQATVADLKRKLDGEDED
jgi:hypothetical protein